jgi:hypothetical protein
LFGEALRLSRQRPCFSALVSAIGRSAMPAHEGSLPQTKALLTGSFKKTKLITRLAGLAGADQSGERSAATEDRIFPTQAMSPTRIWAQI